MQNNWTYYIEGLMRQGNAALARAYLGLGSTDVVNVGYITNSTPLWNDVRIPMSSVRPGVGAPTATAFQPTGVGSLRAYSFNAGGTQRLEFELQVPHGVNESNTYGIRLHIHWACGLSSPVGTVGWIVDANFANIGAAFPAPLSYNSVPVVPTGAWIHMVTPIRTFTGLTESALIVGNIRRSNVDTYAGNDVFGLSLDAHYVVQKVGSLDEMGD